MSENNEVRFLSMRLPRAMERALRERMAITLQSLSATVEGLVREGLWIDRARLLRALDEDRVMVGVRLPEALCRQVEARAKVSGRLTMTAEVTFLVASALEHEAEDGRLEAEQLAAAGAKGGC